MNARCISYCGGIDVDWESFGGFWFEPLKVRLMKWREPEFLQDKGKIELAVCFCIELIE